MEASTKRRLAWGAVAALAVLHYDFWFWTDRALVLGFLPVGLLWQALISLGAGLAWAAVVRWAWPEQLEAWAGAADDGAAGRPR